MTSDKDSGKDSDMDKHLEDDNDTASAARAESFAELVDGLLEGEAIPPALEAEDRALLETATMIVASTQELRLSSERSASIVDQALEQAVLGNGRLTTVPNLADHVAVSLEGERDDTDVIRLSTRRADRVLRALPWVVATVAAAAALLLFISRPDSRHDQSNSEPSAIASKTPPVHQTSRSADALVGQITAKRAEHASERLDVIYADRMAGFRELQLSGTTIGRSE